MTESKIEQIIIDKISAALVSAGVGPSQVIGAWQSSQEDLKAYEASDAQNYVGVKVYPRTYETPTVPYADFAVQITLTTLAERDSGGAEWLQATEAITALLQSWQRSFSEFESDFAISGEFVPSGYAISGGDCGLDRDTCTWQYTQSLDIYGVVI